MAEDKDFFGQTDTGAELHLLAYRLGSIAAVTNHAGTLFQPNTYDAYGIPDPANLGRFSYTGQTIIPGTDLMHYKARVYHARLGSCSAD